ncbi:MAG: hypothetical protein CMH83_01620 [Nocardioides sp.]|nr:hypothetical protein [Nocardioides sp.]
MGYGFGGFLLVLGLVLAFAVNTSVSGLDLQVVGIIMAVVGAALIALTAITLNSKRSNRTVQTTTHSDGTQTVREQRTDSA